MTNIDRPLYQIATDIEEILTSEEWTEQQEQALDQLSTDLTVKGESVASFVNHLNSRADQLKAEIERLQNWKKNLENRAAKHQRLYAGRTHQSRTHRA